MALNEAPMREEDETPMDRMLVRVKGSDGWGQLSDEYNFNGPVSKKLRAWFAAPRPTPWNYEPKEIVIDERNDTVWFDERCYKREYFTTKFDDPIVQSCLPLLEHYWPHFQRLTDEIHVHFMPCVRDDHIAIYHGTLSTCYNDYERCYPDRLCICRRALTLTTPINEIQSVFNCLCDVYTRMTIVKYMIDRAKRRAYEAEVRTLNCYCGGNDYKESIALLKEFGQLVDNLCQASGFTTTATSTIERARDLMMHFALQPGGSLAKHVADDFHQHE